MIPYIIRNASKNDIEELLTVSRRVTDHNSRQYLSDKAVDAFMQSETFEKEIVDNIQDMQILELNGRIIGICVWDKDELRTFMIDCDYQGSGAAGYFLSKVTDAKFREYSTLYLECFELNKRAMAFYDKNGWTEYGCKPDEDLGINRILYKKDSC